MAETFTYRTDDLDEFNLKMQGEKWAGAVYDLDQWLRNKIKYENLDDINQKIYTELRAIIRDILSHYDLTLEMLG